MKRFTMIIALACLLASPTLAGEIPCGIKSTQPGDIPSTGLLGEIPSVQLTQQAEDGFVAGFMAVFGFLS